MAMCQQHELVFKSSKDYLFVIMNSEKMPDSYGDSFYQFYIYHNLDCNFSFLQYFVSEGEKYFFNIWFSLLIFFLFENT